MTEWFMLAECGALLGDEVGEGGGFAEVDAEGAFGADVGEGYFEWVRRRGDLVGFDGGAGYVLFLVVGGAGGYVFVDDEGPLIFAGDGINAKGSNGKLWNCRILVEPQ